MKILILFFLGICCISCTSDAESGDLVVGSDFLGINNNVVLIDTMTVEMSTINFDSLATSATSRILVGNYDDPVYGKVKAQSYIQFGTNDFKIGNSSSDTETTTYAYDSIALILRYDKYVYGDTTQVQTFKIHRLLQNIKPETGDTNLYNSSGFNFNSVPIGSVTFLPRPVSKDSLNVTLDQTFGTDLYQRLKTNQISNYNEFTDYFKGLVITSETSASVIGFGAGSVVRMYYSKRQDQEESSLYKDFSILDLSKQFNNITLDRTGTVLQNLPASDDAIPSARTRNVGYVQSGTGIACRLDFPSIRNIKYLAEKGTIVDAELLLKPVRNSYSLKYPLRDSLNVYVSDKRNRISGLLLGSDGAQLYGKLNMTADEFNENITYSLKLGNFLQQQVSETSTSSLIVTLPNFPKGVDRILLGDQSNTENKLKLKIYYISYQ